MAEIEREKRYLTIDPGILEMGVAVLSINKEHTQILESLLMDVQSESKNSHHSKIDNEKLVRAIEEIVLIAKFYSVDEIIIEKQILIWNPKTKKKMGSVTLCWLEGALYGALCNPNSKKKPICLPIVEVKKHFNICKGSYIPNKKASLRTANLICDGVVPNDHIADCILMAVYFYERKENFTSPEDKYILLPDSDEEEDSDNDDYENNNDLIPYKNF